MKKYTYIILSLALFAVILFPAFSGMMGYSNDYNTAYNNDNYGMMGYGMMGYGFLPFSWTGFILMLLFWALVIVIIVTAVKWIMASLNYEKYKSYNSAIDILKERYARGEINKEEFEDKKKDLL